MNRLLGVLMALACLFGLAGCEQELYTGLSEVEVNEMVAALSSAGISGQKLVQDGQGQEGRTWTLTVDQADMGPRWRCCVRRACRARASRRSARCSRSRGWWPRRPKSACATSTAYRRSCRARCWMWTA
nr:hypothetical protein [Ralstonia sp. TCR112]